MPELENRDELRNILIEETTNYNSDELVRRSMSGKPAITFTEEFYSSDKIEYTSGVVMSSNLSSHIYYSMIVSFIVVLILNEHYNVDRNHNAIVAAIYVGSSTVLTLIVRQIKFLNPVIRIDRTGITVGRKQIKWGEMKYSALLYFYLTGKGGGNKNYLVLVDSGNQIHKFNLYYILPEKIARIIEYYKAEYNKAN